MYIKSTKVQILREPKAKGVFRQQAIEGKREIVRAACHQVDFSGKLNGIIFVVYLVKCIVVSETFWLLACSSTI